MSIHDALSRDAALAALQVRARELDDLRVVLRRVYLGGALTGREFALLLNVVLFEVQSVSRRLEALS